VSVGALAYLESSGASATTSSTTVAPGGSVTLTAKFASPGGPGDSVRFSFPGGGGAGCTDTFNPPSGTTDGSGAITTTSTFGTACGGVLGQTATDLTSGQFVTTSVTVIGLPNTTAEKPAPQHVPFAPAVAILLGISAVVIAGGLLVRRRA
jgi:hypothetical protein